MGVTRIYRLLAFVLLVKDMVMASPATRLIAPVIGMLNVYSVGAVVSVKLLRAVDPIVLTGDRSGVDGKVRECYSEFLGDLRKICRQWLADRLAVGPVVHDAANTLLCREPDIVFEQLPGYIDLGRQFKHPHL